MTFDELQLQSAATRARLRDARTNLTEALRPPRILESAWSSAQSLTAFVAPTLARKISGEAAKSATTLAIGAIVTFITTKFKSKFKHADDKNLDVAQNDRTKTTESIKGRSSLQGSASRRLLRSGVMAAFAFAAGSALSKMFAPTELEKQLLDKYGADFASLVSNAKQDLPNFLVRSSGIGGKLSAALLAVSAISSVIGELSGPRKSTMHKGTPI